MALVPPSTMLSSAAVVVTTVPPNFNPFVPSCDAISKSFEPSAIVVSPARDIIPVPFGVNVILLLAPSAMTIEPEFVPEFVLRVTSPVPDVVTVTFSPLEPS